MINLQPIIWSNYEEIIALEIHEHQKDFVDSNERCLVKAYIDWRQHGVKSFEYGIYNDETPVGFVMIEHRSAERSVLGDNEPNYIVWEFMIDKNHQGKGLGRSAMTVIVEHLKANPEGDAKSVVVPCGLSNAVAAKLYASLGFEDTGIKNGDSNTFMQLKF